VPGPTASHTRHKTSPRRTDVIDRPGADLSCGAKILNKKPESKKTTRRSAKNRAAAGDLV
jgi:hypothetical protein